MGAPLRIGPVAFDEAIAALAGRGIVPPSEYYGKLQGIARAEAFSVAGIAGLDQLDGILRSLTKATADGQTFLRWKSQTLQAPAALSLPEHRLDNIFRTNIQGAYARGRCVQIEKSKAKRPFLRYSAINDSRVRPAHLAMHGHVAAVDDPVWRTWTPPCGYRCRCTVISMTEAQAQRFAEQDAKRLADDDEARHQRAAAIAQGPDEGWDYSPCDALRLDPDKINQQAIEKAFPGIVAGIRRPRHPALTMAAEALLAAFLVALIAAITDDHDDEEQRDE